MIKGLTYKQKELISLGLRLLEIDYLKKLDMKNQDDVNEIAYIQLLYQDIEKQMRDDLEYGNFKS